MTIKPNNIKIPENKIENNLVKELLQTSFSNTRTKINDDASTLMSELAKLLVTEAASRAIAHAKQNRNQDSIQVTLDDMEAVLPHLMLDLP